MAGLVFFYALGAFWGFSLGLEQFRLVFDFSIFGLFGAPLLLAGSRLGYWYALVDVTLHAICSVAALTFLVWIGCFKLSIGGPVWDGLESGLTTIVFIGLPISLMAVQLLRSKDVRSRFSL